MHNDYPVRKVFAPFKSCPGFDRGGGGRLDEIDTCVCHRYVKSDIARPTSVDQVNHAKSYCSKMCRTFSITKAKQLWIKTILSVAIS